MRARARSSPAAPRAGAAWRCAAPAGTRLSVAGVERGRLPLQRPLVLFPGEIEIEVVDVGGHTATVTAHLEAGRSDVLDIPAGSRAEESPRGLAPRVSETPTAPAPGKTSAAAWPLIVGGAAVAVAAAVLIPVSQGRIDDNRSTLAATCNAPPVDDVCATAMNGKREAAQSAEDALATWKAARIGAWIELGVGAAAAIREVLLKVRGGGPPHVTALLVPEANGRPTIASTWGLRF